MMSGTVFPAARNFQICFTFSGTNSSCDQSNAAFLRLFDAVHLTLAANVILEL